MTPLEIDMLVHYYTRPTEYGNKDDNYDAPAVKASLSWMVSADLLKRQELDGTYKITEKGKAYVDAFRNLPLPEKHWIVPRDPV